MHDIHSIVDRALGLSTLLTLLAALLIPSVSVYAGQTDSYTLPKQSYSQSRARQYKVYVPDNLTSPAPMVMALHGCKQTNNDVLNDWGMKEAAERFGFILVAPFITTYDGMRNENCWGFWFNHHRQQNSGEAEDLHQIARAVEANYSIDPERRYLTGLSSGGAMTTVAAVTHNEYWAAAASASGLPYGEDAASVALGGCPGYATFHSVSRVVADMQGEIDDAYPIPLMVLQNKKDCTVLQQAADNTRDAHLKAFGSAGYDTPASAQAAETACAPYNQNNYSCRHIKYTADGTTGSRSVVETVYLDGPLATANPQDTDHGHYWVGGAEGKEGKWAVKAGPSYPDIIWEFFSRHSRNGVGDGPVITLTGDDPLLVEIGTPFTDPGATAYDQEDGSVAVTADCNGVNTVVAGQYSCIYSATDSDDNISTGQRGVEVYDPSEPTETCESVTASPSAHISAARAYTGGNFGLRALANGDDIDIGGSFDSWSSVVLYEGNADNWYAQQPAACSGGSNSGSFSCQDWNAVSLSHQSAGRAYYASGYYTTGGDDFLSAVAGTTHWVKETSDGFYQSGRCD